MAFLRVVVVSSLASFAGAQEGPYGPPPGPYGPGPGPDGPGPDGPPPGPFMPIQQCVVEKTMQWSHELEQGTGGCSKCIKCMNKIIRAHAESSRHFPYTLPDLLRDFPDMQQQVQQQCECAQAQRDCGEQDLKLVTQIGECCDKVPDNPFVKFNAMCNAGIGMLKEQVKHMLSSVGDGPSLLETIAFIQEQALKPDTYFMALEQVEYARQMQISELSSKVAFLAAQTQTADWGLGANFAVVLVSMSFIAFGIIRLSRRA